MGLVTPPPNQAVGDEWGIAVLGCLYVPKPGQQLSPGPSPTTDHVWAHRFVLACLS